MHLLIQYLILFFYFFCEIQEIKTKSSQFNLGKFKGFLVKILDNKKHQHKTILTTKTLLLSDLIEIGIRLEAYSVIVLISFQN